jgi:GxxExxY protein
MLASIGPINHITSRIIEAAIEVHRQLGPGLLEGVYFACLVYELQLAGLKVECECSIPVIYKGVKMACSYRLDLLVEGLVIVELKAIEKILPVHGAQLLTQMKLAGKPAGLLLNFNVPLMKHGITRYLNRQALEALQTT